MTDEKSSGISFNIPKIKRQLSKDNLRNVNIGSRDAQDVVANIERSYLHQSYKRLWKIKTAQIVDNKELEEQYRTKRLKMKEEGRHARDLNEQFAFLMVKDSHVIPKIAKNGLKTKASSSFNALGDSKYGVHVCKYADVVLRMAESLGMDKCNIFIFKVILGKCKMIVGDSTAIGKEPTPNYDCHVSQLPSKPSDATQTQIARSQIYIYEYNDDCETVERPRQCLPYAVVEYERNVNITPSSTLSYDTKSVQKPNSNTYDSSKGSDTRTNTPLARTYKLSSLMDGKQIPRNINVVHSNLPVRQNSCEGMQIQNKMAAPEAVPVYSTSISTTSSMDYSCFRSREDPRIKQRNTVPVPDPSAVLPASVSSISTMLPTSVSSVSPMLPTSMSSVSSMLPASMSSVSSMLPTSMSTVSSMLPATVSGVSSTLASVSSVSSTAISSTHFLPETTNVVADNSILYSKTSSVSGVSNVTLNTGKDVVVWPENLGLSLHSPVKSLGSHSKINCDTIKGNVQEVVCTVTKDINVTDTTVTKVVEKELVSQVKELCTGERNCQVVKDGKLALNSSSEDAKIDTDSAVFSIQIEENGNIGAIQAVPSLEDISVKPERESSKFGRNEGLAHSQVQSMSEREALELCRNELRNFKSEKETTNSVLNEDLIQAQKQKHFADKFVHRVDDVSNIPLPDHDPNKPGNSAAACKEQSLPLGDESFSKQNTSSTGSFKINVKTESLVSSASVDKKESVRSSSVDKHEVNMQSQNFQKFTEGNKKDITEFKQIHEMEIKKEIRECDVYHPESPTFSPEPDLEEEDMIDEESTVIEGRGKELKISPIKKDVDLRFSNTSASMDIDMRNSCSNLALDKQASSSHSSLNLHPVPSNSSFMVRSSHEKVGKEVFQNNTVLDVDLRPLKSESNTMGDVDFRVSGKSGNMDIDYRNPNQLYSYNSVKQYYDHGNYYDQSSQSNNSNQYFTNSQSYYTPSHSAYKSTQVLDSYSTRDKVLSGQESSQRSGGYSTTTGTTGAYVGQQWQDDHCNQSHIDSTYYESHYQTSNITPRYVSDDYQHETEMSDTSLGSSHGYSPVDSKQRLPSHYQVSDSTSLNISNKSDNTSTHANKRTKRLSLDDYKNRQQQRNKTEDSVGLDSSASVLPNMQNILESVNLDVGNLKNILQTVNVKVDSDDSFVGNEKVKSEMGQSEFVGPESQCANPQNIYNTSISTETKPDISYLGYQNQASTSWVPSEQSTREQTVQSRSFTKNSYRNDQYLKPSPPKDLSFLPIVKSENIVYTTNFIEQTGIPGFDTPDHEHSDPSISVKIEDIDQMMDVDLNQSFEEGFPVNDDEHNTDSDASECSPIKTEQESSDVQMDVLNAKVNLDFDLNKIKREIPDSVEMSEKIVLKVEPDSRNEVKLMNDDIGRCTDEEQPGLEHRDKVLTLTPVKDERVDPLDRDIVVQRTLFKYEDDEKSRTKECESQSNREGFESVNCDTENSESVFMEPGVKVSREDMHNKKTSKSVLEMDIPGQEAGSSVINLNELTEKVQLLSQQKSKSKVKKINKDMMGYKYRKRRRKKRTLTSGSSGTYSSSNVEILSTTSSDVIDYQRDIDNSSCKSGERKSYCSPEKFTTRQLEDYGLTHWSQALHSSLFQPKVVLKDLRNEGIESDGIYGNIYTDENVGKSSVSTQKTISLPMTDDDFSLQKQDMVNQWLHTARKKIKLTLNPKTSPKPILENIEDKSAERVSDPDNQRTIPVLHGGVVPHKKKLPIKQHNKEKEKVDNLDFNEPRTVLKIPLVASTRERPGVNNGNQDNRSVISSTNNNMSAPAISVSTVQQISPIMGCSLIQKHQKIPSRPSTPVGNVCQSTPLMSMTLSGNVSTTSPVKREFGTFAPATVQNLAHQLSASPLVSVNDSSIRYPPTGHQQSSYVAPRVSAPYIPPAVASSPVMHPQTISAYQQQVNQQLQVPKAINTPVQNLISTVQRSLIRPNLPGQSFVATSTSPNVGHLQQQGGLNARFLGPSLYASQLRNINPAQQALFQPTGSINPIQQCHVQPRNINSIQQVQIASGIPNQAQQSLLQPPRNINPIQQVQMPARNVNPIQHPQLPAGNTIPPQQTQFQAAVISLTQRPQTQPRTVNPVQPVQMNSANVHQIQQARLQIPVSQSQIRHYVTPSTQIPRYGVSVPPYPQQTQAIAPSSLHVNPIPTQGSQMPRVPFSNFQPATSQQTGLIQQIQSVTAQRQSLVPQVRPVTPQRQALFHHIQPVTPQRASLVPQIRPVIPHNTGQVSQTSNASNIPVITGRQVVTRQNNPQMVTTLSSPAGTKRPADLIDWFSDKFLPKKPSLEADYSSQSTTLQQTFGVRSASSVTYSTDPLHNKSVSVSTTTADHFLGLSCQHMCAGNSEDDSSASSQHRSVGSFEGDANDSSENCLNLSGSSDELDEKSVDDLSKKHFMIRQALKELGEEKVSSGDLDETSVDDLSKKHFMIRQALKELEEEKVSSGDLDETSVDDLSKKHFMIRQALKELEEEKGSPRPGDLDEKSMDDLSNKHFMIRQALKELEEEKLYSELTQSDENNESIGNERIVIVKNSSEESSELEDGEIEDEPEEESDRIGWSQSNESLGNSEILRVSVCVSKPETRKVVISDNENLYSANNIHDKDGEITKSVSSFDKRLVRNNDVVSLNESKSVSEKSMSASEKNRHFGEKGSSVFEKGVTVSQKRSFGERGWSVGEKSGCGFEKGMPMSEKSRSVGEKGMSVSEKGNCVSEKNRSVSIIRKKHISEVAQSWTEMLMVEDKRIEKVKEKTRVLLIKNNEPRTLGDFAVQELKDESLLALQQYVSIDMSTEIATLSKKRRRTLKKNLVNELQAVKTKLQSGKIKLDNKGKGKEEKVVVVSQDSKNDIKISEDSPLTHKQIKEEFEIVRDCIKKSIVKETIEEVLEKNNNILVNTGNSQIVQDLQTFENELSSRINWFVQKHIGFVNRRVPKSLLFESEYEKYISEEGIFLILSSSISKKSFSKLLELKEKIENLNSLTQICKNVNDQEKLVELEFEKRTLHFDRETAFKTLTGSLSTKRVLKLQNKIKFYRRIYLYIKEKFGEDMVSKLKYLTESMNDLVKVEALAVRLLDQKANSD